MVLVEMFLRFWSRDWFITFLAQYNIAPAVYFVSNEVDFCNVPFAREKKRKKNQKELGYNENVSGSFSVITDSTQRQAKKKKIIIIIIPLQRCNHDHIYHVRQLVKMNLITHKYRNGGTWNLSLTSLSSTLYPLLQPSVGNIRWYPLFTVHWCCK